MQAVADVLVIGAGPGGATTAALLAEAGRDVLLLEEGPDLPLSSCRPFSREEMQQKYRNAGVTVALGQPKVAYAEGRCAGGGSEINSGLYHRVSEAVLQEWERDFRVQGLDRAELARHQEQVEADIGISPLPGPAPAASLALARGADRMGWQAIEVPRWYRYAEDGTPLKQSMTATLLPRARAAGARLSFGCRVRRVVREAQGWRAEGHDAQGAAATWRARQVFLCGGAIQTPALLQRSGLAPLAGKRLHLHPSLKITALFDDEVNDEHAGVPVHQVKTFSPRLSMGCSISSPAFLQMALLDYPSGDVIVQRDWRRMATYYVMARDGCGSVRHVPGFSDPLVRFDLGHEGFANLRDGLLKLGQCLLAAGARVLYPSVAPGRPVNDAQGLQALVASLRPVEMQLMTIHLMGSCPMGEARGVCVADSWGRVHGQPGLHVNDASLLCTGLGANPQGTIMTLARRNVQAFLSSTA